MSELPSDVDRVAIAGDWHGEIRYARHAMNHALQHGVQGIVHTGDLGVWPGAEGARYLADLELELAQRGMWLAFVDGNHDDHWQINAVPILPSGVRLMSPSIFHLPRGFRWTWQYRRWMALGGGVSLDKQVRTIGRSWWPEEALTVADVERATAGGTVDALVSHDIASGVAVPGLHNRWDPKALAEAMAHRKLLRQVADAVRPEAWWHGHMHVKYQQNVVFGDDVNRKLCWVYGLDCNGGPVKNNVMIVNVATLMEVESTVQG